MSTNYVFSGTARTLGRHGTVAQGQVLALTDAEVADVAGNDSFFPLPSRGQLELKITEATELTAADVGKKIICNHTAALTITLDEALGAGDWFEIYFGQNASADAVTIDTNDQLSGRVETYTVTNAGSGYSSIPTVAITGGGGSGATATARMKVLTAPPAAAGTGYAPGDTVTLAGGTSTTAGVLTVATAKAVSAAINAAGTGYTANDVLTVAGGTSTSAVQITVDTVDGSGVIQTAHITQVGSYTVLPSNAVAVTGGSGTGATFDLGWGVLTVTVTTAGVYSVLPTNAIAQASTSGSGSGATFNATWGVASVVKTAGGEGYTSAPTVGFSGGSGTGAAATAVVTEEAGDIILTAAEDSVGIYHNGARWVTFS